MGHVDAEMRIFSASEMMQKSQCFCDLCAAQPRFGPWPAQSSVSATEQWLSPPKLIPVKGSAGIPPFSLSHQAGELSCSLPNILILPCSGCCKAQHVFTEVKVSCTNYLQPNLDLGYLRKDFECCVFIQNLPNRVYSLILLRTGMPTGTAGV